MNQRPLKGVNLGGWLITEKWMTPGVFSGTDAVDEYTLSQTEKGRAAIKAHRDTFIQESDFEWLQKNGIQILRVPVGYWLFDGDQNLLPHVDYLDWVMDMAKKYNMQVLIDLHGLQGSQNGQDHSGRIGKANWFRSSKYRQASIETLEKIAKRYANHPKFWGLQIINEPPMKLFNCKLRQFYKDAASKLSPLLGDTRLIFSDAFTPRLMSGAMSKSALPHSYMDVHVYQPFKFWVRFFPMSTFINWLLRKKKLFAKFAKTQPIIIGEWSGVVRYEDLMKIPENERDAFTKYYINTQIDVFSSAEAWFYWSYKTENAGTWNYRSLVESGIIE